MSYKRVCFRHDASINSFAFVFFSFSSFPSSVHNIVLNNIFFRPHSWHRYFWLAQLFAKLFFTIRHLSAWLIVFFSGICFFEIFDHLRQFMTTSMFALLQLSSCLITIFFVLSSRDSHWLLNFWVFSCWIRRHGLLINPFFRISFLNSRMPLRI